MLDSERTYLLQNKWTASPFLPNIFSLGAHKSAFVRLLLKKEHFLQLIVAEDKDFEERLRLLDFVARKNIVVPIVYRFDSTVLT